MSTLAERITECRKDLGLNKREFAALVGVSAPTVSDWENGVIHELKGKNLVRVASACKVRPEWLEKGIGFKYPRVIKTDTDDVIVFGDRANMSAIHNQQPHVQQQGMRDEAPPGAGVTAWENQEDLDQEKYLMLPLYTDVHLSAGNGANADWRQKDHEALPFKVGFFISRQLKPENCKLLSISGESMSPSLENKDTVMIDTSQTEIRENEIYAFIYHAELYIKRLFKIPGGGIKARSDNQDYEPFEIKESELQHLMILGRKVYRSG